MQKSFAESALPLIKVVPVQPHCFAFGGFELQMLGAMEASRGLGANISELNLWSRLNNFDLIHLWGFEVAHYNIARWAHLDGKKLVMSALLTHPTMLACLRNIASRVVGPSRLKFEMLPWLSALTVVNDGHAQYAASVLGVNKRKIYVIPNIVEDIFYAPPLNAPNLNIDFHDYVLCTGNICARKNQLMLAKACKKLDIPLLLIGGVMPGEEQYGVAVAEIINSSKKMKWINGFPSGSQELAAAYQNSLLFALPSYLEAQPISALEAGAAKKPILLANKPYANQEFYKNAALVTPDSEDSLISGLRRIMDCPSNYQPPESALELCRRERVGDAYLNMYKQVANIGL